MNAYVSIDKSQHVISNEYEKNQLVTDFLSSELM